MLEADGQFGVATVSANTGGSETATIDVQLGLSPASVTVQVTPNSVPETGGEADLLAIVRDDRGQPLEKAEVNFRAEIGTLDSGGTLISTAADGTASDRLVVSSGDLDTVSGDSFEVGVDVGSGGGQLVTTNVSVAIQRLPRADFTFNTRNLLVAFEDTTDGRTTSWLWTFGDGNTSTRQNPTHTYDQPGTYAVTFRATNSLGSDEVTKFVQVTGQ
ncbi:MAG: PKD domain-containing protein [Holophagales bacterium]|nr:PKD domain-containing protein [Holophagales bacterium]MYF97222.1 PKD domain-containing protein [Holophagales bacterium]